jgi:hypothetical protein
MNKLIIMMLLIIASFGESGMLKNDDLLLQIEGQRNGKPYNINIAIDKSKFIVFYKYGTENNYFADSLTKYFHADKSMKYWNIISDIKKQKSFSTEIVMKSRNITHFFIQTNKNQLNAYINKEIDTKNVERLITLIISMSDGKLDFLHYKNYFRLDKCD